MQFKFLLLACDIWHYFLNVDIISVVQSSSPTIFYSNMEVDYYSEPSLMDAKNLPSLQRVNIKAEGIVKWVLQ